MDSHFCSDCFHLQTADLAFYISKFSALIANLHLSSANLHLSSANLHLSILIIKFAIQKDISWISKNQFTINNSTQLTYGFGESPQILYGSRPGNHIPICRQMWNPTPNDVSTYKWQEQTHFRRSHQQNPQCVSRPICLMADVWRRGYDNQRKYRNLRASNRCKRRTRPLSNY